MIKPGKQHVASIFWHNFNTTKWITLGATMHTILKGVCGPSTKINKNTLMEKPAFQASVNIAKGPGWWKTECKTKCKAKRQVLVIQGQLGAGNQTGPCHSRWSVGTDQGLDFHRILNSISSRMHFLQRWMADKNAEHNPEDISDRSIGINAFHGENWW